MSEFYKKLEVDTNDLYFALGLATGTIIRLKSLLPEEEKFETEELILRLLSVCSPPVFFNEEADPK